MGEGEAGLPGEGGVRTVSRGLYRIWFAGRVEGAAQKRRRIGEVEKRQLCQISVFHALEVKVMAVIMV